MATDAGFRSTACPEYEALLEDYLGGNLKVAHAKSVVAHCEICEGCRHAMEEAAASARLLQFAPATVIPGPAFARTVTARIRAAEEAKVAAQAAFWQPLASLAWRIAATATLALGLLLTYDVGWAHRSQPNTVAARPIEVSDVLSVEPATTPANGDEVLMMVAETNHADQ